MADQGERGFWIEEFNRFFGHNKDEPHGVKDWKISTLGPTDVGKTVLISGLYAQFHLGTEHGKQIGIESIGMELHDMLDDVARGLRAKPARLPRSTGQIHNARFKFLVKDGHQRRQKIVTLQDHAGEHLIRSNPHHKETLEHLKSSDTFMVFMDSRELLREDYHDAADDMELEVIKNLIRSISNELHEGDIIPISIVFSKADLIRGRESEVIEKGMNILNALSEELPQCIFSFSTASVVKTNSQGQSDRYFFAPKNIEVPFLFSIAGIVVRNSNFLQMAAEETLREKEEVKSQKLDGMGFFERIGARIRKGMEVRRLDSKSRRYISLSSYDIELARSAINLINLNKTVTFMQSGMIYDNAEELFSGLI